MPNQRILLTVTHGYGLTKNEKLTHKSINENDLIEKVAELSWGAEKPVPVINSKRQ